MQSEREREREISLSLTVWNLPGENCKRSTSQCSHHKSPSPSPEGPSRPRPVSQITLFLNCNLGTALRSLQVWYSAEKTRRRPSKLWGCWQRECRWRNVFWDFHIPPPDGEKPPSWSLILTPVSLRRRPHLCLAGAPNRRVSPFFILMKCGFPPWQAAEAARAQSGNERPEGLGVFKRQHIEGT